MSLYDLLEKTNLSITDTPVRFNFAVILFPGGTPVPNPIDIRFSKVSGMNCSIETEPLEEGGENLARHLLPKRVNYETLKLERGMVIGSLLNLEFSLAMTTLEMVPGNAMVCVLNDLGIPVSSWLFLKTYPLKWSVSDLDANQNDLMIDTMELAYEKFIPLRL
ncbi:phage tail protein [uncultured Shewanella sp.]|uniref:phage tail protein n=1 Tax=uncultured Shewanella sp. TaxID=173975 RepID=UPI00262E540F|nr:phage tail protein [uncultured Shewanella sp.]